MSIANIAFPKELLPIAEKVSNQIGIPLEVAKPLVVHMNVLAADRLTRAVLDHVEGRDPPVFPDMEKMSTITSYGNHTAIWLLLTGPLGIPEEKMVAAVMFTASCIAQYLSEKMKAELAARLDKDGGNGSGSGGSSNLN